MNQYNLSIEEITRLISLYSRITSQEKRIYAQGYLNGLSAFSSVVPTCHVDANSDPGNEGEQNKVQIETA